jgi:hypothetical protein
MKIVFAGPSLFGADVDATGLDIRPPARQGDILKAIADGATAIGIIDGVFGLAASVWHKEILFALARDIRVLGASSMGALRAAECFAFGMEPVGRIASAYLSGELDDDAAVALTMAPAEFGYQAFTEPLVDVWPTIASLVESGCLSDEEGERFRLAAEAMYFEERTVEAIVHRAFGPAGSLQIAQDYYRHRISAKTEDALMLLSAMREEPPCARQQGWTFVRSPFWEKHSQGPLTHRSRS